MDCRHALWAPFGLVNWFGLVVRKCCELCFFAILMFLNADTIHEARGEEIEPSKIALDSINSRAWTALSEPDTETVLQALTTQTQGNYSRIETLRGTAKMRVRRELTPRKAIEVLQSHLKETIATPFLEDNRCETDFVIDFAKDTVFRRERNGSLSWLRKGSDVPLTFPDLQVITANSLVDAEACLLFRPEHKYSEFIDVQGNPEARNKRAAFRDAPSEARYHGLVEPRNFYRFNGETFFWAELQMIGNRLKGENRQKDAVALHCYRASDTTGTWYRTDTQMSGPLGPLLECKIWSPRDGLNPTSFTLWKGGLGHELLYEAKWDYEDAKGIYIPRVWRETYYANGSMKSSNDCTLSNIVVNEPIAPSEFSYQSLGMKDGDLVMDRIEKVCYVLRDGKPVKLANFGDKYTAPNVRKPARSGGSMLMAAIAAIVLLTALLIARRYRSGRRTT